MTVIVFSVKLHVSLIHLGGEVLCVSKPGMLARHFSEATVGFKSKLTALAHSGFFLQTMLFCFLKLGIDLCSTSVLHESGICSTQFVVQNAISRKIYIS